jgi:hypothetical protein
MSDGQMMVSGVGVATTSHRGFTPEEIADRCVDKLMYVSEDAPPAIKDQAKAFKDRMRVVVAFYMQDAIKNDRVTMYNQLAQAGHSELADIIRRL